MPVMLPQNFMWEKTWWQYVAMKFGLGKFVSSAGGFGGLPHFRRESQGTLGAEDYGHTS